MKAMLRGLIMKGVCIMSVVKCFPFLSFLSSSSSSSFFFFFWYLNPIYHVCGVPLCTDGVVG